MVTERSVISALCGVAIVSTMTTVSLHKKGKPKFFRFMWLYLSLCFFAVVFTFQATVGMQSNADEVQIAFRPTSRRSSPRSMRSSKSLQQQTPKTSSTPGSIVDFEKQDGVVILAKIHGGNDETSMAELRQSLCLLKQAYNGRMNYDQIVFTTEPLNDDYVQLLTDIVAPAKLTIVVDSKPLQDEIAALDPERRRKFLAKCNTTDPSTITWVTRCEEHLLHELGDKKLSYNWMAEFRTKYLWTHPALDAYKYVMYVSKPQSKQQPLFFNFGQISMEFSLTCLFSISVRRRRLSYPSLG